MGFANQFRQQDKRTLKGNRMVGVVVSVDDDKKQQRIKVRVHELHKNIPDDALPWLSPSSLTSSNAAGGAGTHGPIPLKGSKVWTQFTDDSQYHGEYLGGVNTQDTKLDDFTKEGSKWSKNYGHAFGGVDGSGNFDGIDNKADLKESTHVSGTTHQIDGKGNEYHGTNGDANTGNKDAVGEHAKGYTHDIHGDCNINCSGVVNISGATSINLKAGSVLKIHGSGSIEIIGGQSIKLVAPSITASTEIVVGGGGSPDSPTAPKELKTRKRPEIKSTDNDIRY